jgi:hypothetical protein
VYTLYTLTGKIPLPLQMLKDKRLQKGRTLHSAFRDVAGNVWQYEK